MNEWSVGTLPDFADLLSGCTVSAAQFGQGVKYITVQQLYYGNTIDVSSSPSVRVSDFETDRYKLIDGDILIGKSSVKLEGIGYPAWFKSFNELVIFSNFTVRIRSKSIIDQSYLFYWLRSSFARKWIIAQAQQSALTNINQNIINRFPVYFPKNINSQKKIASILGSIDLAIEKTEALIEKYQQIKVGLMHDLFTRGIGPDGKLRPPRELAPELYQETPIGWIPKDWEPVRLKEILNKSGGYLQTGPFGSQLHSHEYTDEGVPVVMPQDINDGKVDESQISRITEIRAQSLLKHRLKVDDIIIARRGELSRAAAISDIERGWICGTGCFLLRLGGTDLDARFYALTYSHPIIQRQVEGLAVGTTMPSLNNEIMGKLIFPSFSKEEQTAIADKVELANKKITSLQKQLIKFNKEKSGLMHDLLTGKVQVPINSVEAENV